MAIVKFAAPVADMSGTVGGLTYSRNKSGSFVKPWAKGSNPRTAAQTAQRASLSAYAQNWQNITPAQRTAWDVYAALPAQDKTNSIGELYSISGFNWYVALSNNLVRAGLAAIDSAPLLGTPATPIIEAAFLHDDSSPSSSRIQMTVGSPTLTADHIAYGVVVNTPGQANPTIGRKWLTTEVPNVSRIINFRGEINAKFGTIQLEQFAFYEVRIQNAEGRQGPPASISVQATV